MLSCYHIISINEEWLREFFAELLGTFFLVFMGNNSVAEKVLTYSEAGSPLSIYIGYALGLFMGLIVSAGVSGGHLNPAVTVAGAFARKFRWAKVPHYLLAQYLGGFFGACCTYLIYMDSFDTFHNENGVNITTAGIFATFPKEDVSLTGCFIDQILGTMVLVIAIYAITDELNSNVPLHLVSLYVSLVLLGIGCSLGVNQGFALNPARDLAPRIFTSITFWGWDVFSSESYWYVPVIGPHVGAIIGAGIYVTFFERLRSFNGDDTDDNNNLTRNNEQQRSERKMSLSKTDEKPLSRTAAEGDVGQNVGRLNYQRLLCTLFPEKMKVPVPSSSTSKSETYTCYL